MGCDNWIKCDYLVNLLTTTSIISFLSNLGRQTSMKSIGKSLQAASGIFRGLSSPGGCTRSALFLWLVSQPVT